MIAYLDAERVRLPVQRLPLHLERAVAVAASVDPRTVRKVVEGRPTSSMPRERVIKALRELQLGQYVPAEGGGS